MVVGTTDHAIPPPEVSSDPGARESPSQLARSWFHRQDDEGRVVMSLALDRWDDSPAWHVGAWNSCILGAGVT